MKEVLFRGISEETGEWVYGQLLKSNFNSYIITRVDTLNDKLDFIQYEQVIDKTVGQYTSINDIKGTKIFEGDISDCEIYNVKDRGEVTYSEMLGAYFLIGLNRSDTELWGASNKVVIGNVHQNPELLDI